MIGIRRSLPRGALWLLLAASGPLLAACAQPKGSYSHESPFYDYRGPETAGLEAYDPTSEGLLIVGNAYDTGGVRVSRGYYLNFRRLDESGGLTDDRSKGFAARRVSLDEHRRKGMIRADFSDPSHDVFRLKPGTYVLFSVTQSNVTLFVTCMDSPAPGFRIAAGEVLYVGDIILESGERTGFFDLKTMNWNPGAARAALWNLGGDPKEMKQRPLELVEVEDWNCEEP